MFIHNEHFIVYLLETVTVSHYTGIITKGNYTYLMLALLNIHWEALAAITSEAGNSFSSSLWLYKGENSKYKTDCINTIKLKG